MAQYGPANGRIEDSIFGNSRSLRQKTSEKIGKMFFFGGGGGGGAEGVEGGISSQLVKSFHAI